MRSRFFLIAVAIIITANFLLTGCDYKNAEEDKAEQSTGKVTENVIYTYEVVNKELEFISNEKKELWREPLVKLLSSDEFLAKEDEKLMGSLIYSNESGHHIIYNLGLFDINTDGMPELMVGLGGGSKGNNAYSVYDILAGTEIGSFEGSFDDSLCIYFNKMTGEYETICEFWWQHGLSNPFVYINKMTISPTLNTDNQVHQENYLYVNYQINIEGDCENSKYEVRGEDANFEQYLRAHMAFNSDYVRIYETGLTLIKQYDYSTPAEIVEALLSTGQQFVMPEEEKG